MGQRGKGRDDVVTRQEKKTPEKLRVKVTNIFLYSAAQEKKEMEKVLESFPGGGDASLFANNNIIRRRQVSWGDETMNSFAPLTPLLDVNLGKATTPTATRDVVLGTTVAAIRSKC